MMYMMESNKRAVPPNIFLPPGFRFHPTDDELIAFYLMKKVVNNKFSAHAIADVDLNKYEPWELPERANMGEKEWYFFSLRDRKYPTGMRTNRATEAGYWKATGKDRDIRGSHLSGNHNALVGMKKTLVFYRGRAPRGEKTNWVMHEYRLEGQTAHLYGSRAAKEEWVVCRIFQKKALAGKRLSSAPGEDGQDSDAPSSPAATEHYEKSEFEMEGAHDHLSCITTFDSNNKEALQASSNNIWNSSMKNSFASSGIYSGGLAKLSPLFDPEFLPALDSSSHRTSSVNNHMFPKALDNSFKGGLKSCKSEPLISDNNNYKMMETLTGILGESLSYETILLQQQQQQQQQQQGQICGIPTDQLVNEMLFSRYLADPSSSELDLPYAY